MEMTTEARRNRPDPPERAALIELGRQTPALEQAYRDARAAFVATGRALNGHRARFDQRAGELEAAGGVLDAEGVAEMRRPIAAMPVTAEDLA